jgi:HlyD family secretion protein
MISGHMKPILILPFVALAIGTACRDASPPVAVGTLERYRIELRAERQEPILRLAVKEGDQVELGDPVVELDSRRIVALLAQAEASRDLAAARLAEAVRGIRHEEIDQARAQLAEAEAALIEQQPNLQRARRLVSEGIEPQSVLDSAEANQIAAVARRDAARSSLEKFLNGATVEELDQARAELARAEADVAKLAIDTERMIIAAPRAGTIDALPFREGDEPPVGSPVAVLLADGAPFARVYVPAELRPGAVAGATVSVLVEGFDSPFEGRIRMVSAEAAFTPYYALTERDRGHFTYLAEIDLVEDAARDLPTGLPVEVSF